MTNDEAEQITEYYAQKWDQEARSRKLNRLNRRSSRYDME